VDIDIRLLMNLEKFIKDHCIVGSWGEGGGLTHTHIQMVVKGVIGIFVVLSKKVKVDLGWKQVPPNGLLLLARS
jgi:hypothetical protein